MSLQIRRRPRVDDSHLPATLHPLLRQIFASRGVEDPALLERSASQLLPPQRLYGMEQAVPLLADALTAQKRILIVGDFDCDGATSSALCVLALRAMGVATSIFWCPTASSLATASPRNCRAGGGPWRRVSDHGG